jgi:hypothetical protein
MLGEKDILSGREAALMLTSFREMEANNIEKVVRLLRSQRGGL